MVNLTIEPRHAHGRETFSVYEFGTYEASSVLAGQTRKSFVDCFDTYAEAARAYPKADFGSRSANNTFGHLPGEDDPIPGGAYPDDIDGGY